MFSNADKWEAAKREVEYRRRVYGRRVSEGKMNQKFSDRQIAIMQAIADDYRQLADKERLI